MSSNLPKLKIKLTKYQQRLITLGWLIIAMNFIIVGISYTNLPDIIPAHFNYKGEVDGFGTKSTIWTFPILSSIIIFTGIFTSIFCQLGDLFFSYLKRKAKIKDTGNYLPGHGGLLDRVDGILLGVPMGFIVLSLFLLK